MKSLRKSILTLLALTLFGGAGAWAQEEVLLTTITATGAEQASYSTANVATVSFSYTAEGSSAYNANWGWWGYGCSATVTAAEGYTITRCVFYDNENRTATDSEAPFVVETTEEDKTPKVNGTKINNNSKGIKKIEVYGYAPEPAAIELTPNATGKVWSLGQTPDYDLELQVEYYEAHALKGIPAGWTVKVNGVEQQTPYQGDSLMITETDSVTLVPAGNPRRVKSVTLEDEAPAVQTVTWNHDDITGSGIGTTFTKDGVTITADMIDFDDKNFMMGGTFTTTLGNFTKIEVTTGYWGASGTGWSGSGEHSATWTGNASSVSFSGDIMGAGMGTTKFVFTIE